MSATTEPVARSWTTAEKIAVLTDHLADKNVRCPCCAGPLLVSDGATLTVLYCPQCRRGCSLADRKEGK